MKILKKGRQENKNTKTFTCQKCGCEFTAEEDEYAEKYNIAISAYKEFVCSCPECHKIVSLTEVSDNGYTWITGDETLNENIRWPTTGTIAAPTVYTVSSGYAPSCTTASTSSASAAEAENITLTAHTSNTNTATNVNIAQPAGCEILDTSISLSNLIKKSSKVKDEKTHKEGEKR